MQYTTHAEMDKKIYLCAHEFEDYRIIGVFNQDTIN